VSNTHEPLFLSAELLFRREFFHASTNPVMYRHPATITCSLACLSAGTCAPDRGNSSGVVRARFLAPRELCFGCIRVCVYAWVWMLMAGSLPPLLVRPFAESCFLSFSRSVAHDLALVVRSASHHLLFLLTLARREIPCLWLARDSGCTTTLRTHLRYAPWAARISPAAIYAGSVVVVEINRPIDHPVMPTRANPTTRDHKFTLKHPRLLCAQSHRFQSPSRTDVTWAGWCI